MITRELISASLANHLWQSTLFAVAVGLLALVLRRNRAQIRYALWLIASLKFLVPFSLLLAIGSHLTWHAGAVTAHSAVSFAIQHIGQPLLTPNIFSVSQSTASSPAHTGALIVFLMWLAGFLVVVASWFRHWRRIGVALRQAVPLPCSAPIRILSSPFLLEPGVFGIFRPVLVLPAGITAHLTAAHVDAILTHEICHVRRRDNLAAALHMLVEALFWFHPLVWWIGARLIEERERACDEEVLRLGNRPNIYAESILKTCQFYLESPLACVSGITGSDLKKRIVRIMSESRAARLSFRKKLLLVAAGVGALAVPLAVGLTNASQDSTAGSLSFEVASIKPTKPGARGSMVHLRPGGRIVANNVNVELLLEEVYHVTKSQISGAPSWIDSEGYDIDAKPDDSIAATIDKLPPEQRLDKINEMVRSLLADRFRLVLGHETKEMSVYALVVVKNGPKFHESTYKPPEKLPDSPPPPGKGGPPPQGVYTTGPGNLTVAYSDIGGFVNVLSRHIVNRVVIDKTGLTGKYDFTLKWTPDLNQGPVMPGAGPAADGAPRPDPNGPSLFTALQEQLGLKLESQKAPVDILVIKHIERPTEN